MERIIEENLDKNIEINSHKVREIKTFDVFVCVLKAFGKIKYSLSALNSFFLIIL